MDAPRSKLSLKMVILLVNLKSSSNKMPQHGAFYVTPNINLHNTREGGNA